MADQTAASDSNPTFDPYHHLQIAPNPDGTITRLAEYPNTHPPTCDSPVLSKDIPAVNQSNNTWVRLFLPRHVLDQSPSPTTKLPLVVFYHGGGFILLSAGSTIFHDFCVNLAIDVPVVIASVDYDDAMEALHWIKTAQDDWLKDYADLSNCFLMGSSAGGNIAYHAGLRAVVGVDHLNPLKIKGLILQQPFFGGTRRSGSELRMAKDPVLPVSCCDLMWDLSLPRGFDRDHEYCNPTVGGGSKHLDEIKALGWRVLVSGCDGDPLMDRQIELVKMLEEKGVQVVGRFIQGGCHGFEDFELSKAHELFVVIKSFIFQL